MLVELRCGACGLGLAIPAPGRLGEPSALLRGLPSVAGRDRMNGGETCRDNVRVIPSGPGPEVRFRGEKPPQWSAGRRACFAKHAAPSTRRQMLPSAVPALRSLTCVRGGKETAVPTP